MEKRGLYLLILIVSPANPFCIDEGCQLECVTSQFEEHGDFSTMLEGEYCVIVIKNSNVFLQLDAVPSPLRIINSFVNGIFYNDVDWIKPNTKPTSTLTTTSTLIKTPTQSTEATTRPVKTSIQPFNITTHSFEVTTRPVNMSTRSVKSSSHSFEATTRSNNTTTHSFETTTRPIKTSTQPVNTPTITTAGPVITSTYPEITDIESTTITNVFALKNVDRNKSWIKIGCAFVLGCLVTLITGLLVFKCWKNTQHQQQHQYAIEMQQVSCTYI